MATIEPIKQADDRQAFRLTTEEAEIVAESLALEWSIQARAIEDEVDSAFGEPERRKMHLSNAAWKVRRQAIIVDLLEQLGWVA